MQNLIKIFKKINKKKRKKKHTYVLHFMNKSNQAYLKNYFQRKIKIYEL